MEVNHDSLLCCVKHCPRRAVSSESGRIGQWIVLISYCDEHANEVAHDEPMGGVGLDSSRLRILAVPEALPEVGGRFAGLD
jgi:hypothetical protein